MKETNRTNPPKPQINNIKNRLLFLSPTVKEGLERECNKDDFEALDDKALGKGGFGHVWKVRHKVTQKIYAIKVINKDYIKKENMTEQINREVEIMYKTDNPYIIKLYNHYEDEDNFYLIMHCAAKGQLYSLLKKQKRLDERTVAQFMREVISAVNYLHSLKPPILHRDIKPENILLDTDGRARLADFGWSNFSEDDKKRETYCGTPEYLAPEMVMKQGHNEKIDIWSLGVLMFELLTGRPPFVYKGDTSKLYSDIKNLKIMWTDDFPILAKNLVSKILKIKPEERISLQEILDHPWFAEIEPTRKLLSEYPYDPAKKLRSHLVHVLPKDEEKVETEIKNYLLERKESLKKNETKAPIINIVDVKDKMLEEELKKKQDEIKQLKEEVNKKEKVIGNMSSKSDNKSGTDETTIKIREQERLTLICEVEAKTIRILELESQLNLLKSENEQLNKQNRNLKENLDIANQRIAELEKQNLDLTTKFNNLEDLRQEEIMTYEKKIRINEMQFIENQSGSKENEQDKIAMMTKEYLGDLNDLLRNKLIKLEEKIIAQSREHAEFREQTINQLEIKHHEILKSVKEQFERVINEEKTLFKKQLDNANLQNTTNSKSLDWYKSQIHELANYKQKFNQIEHNISKINNDKETLKYSRDVMAEKNKYLDDLIKAKTEECLKLKVDKEKFKNAFLEAEMIFGKHIKTKKLRDLINFKDQID